jgi:hypothetical protein
MFLNISATVVLFALQVWGRLNSCCECPTDAALDALGAAAEHTAADLGITPTTIATTAIAIAHILFPFVRILVVFLVAMGPPSVVVHAQFLLGSPVRLLLMPQLLLMHHGLIVSNSVAVLQAFGGYSPPFERTPKFGFDEIKNSTATASADAKAMDREAMDREAMDCEGASNGRRGNGGSALDKGVALDQGAATRDRAQKQTKGNQRRDSGMGLGTLLSTPMLAERAIALLLVILIAAGFYCNCFCCRCTSAARAKVGTKGGEEYWDSAVADDTLLPWIIFFAASFLYLIYLHEQGSKSTLAGRTY